MTSSFGRALVLICAGWWFLGNEANCQAQKTEAEHKVPATDEFGGVAIDSQVQQTDEDRKLVEKIKAVAEKGDPSEQCELGLIYFYKLAGELDYAKAVYWFRKAAEQGHGKAQYNLGVCYERGDGVAKDESVAVKWYRKAAAQGDAMAQSMLGCCYHEGEAEAKDYAE